MVAGAGGWVDVLMLLTWDRPMSGLRPEMGKKKAEKWTLTCETADLLERLAVEPLTNPENFKITQKSGTDMTGRPGDQMVEMHGGSTASYLMRTPRVPSFMFILNLGLEAKGLLALQGGRGIASVVRWNLRVVIFGVEK